MNLLWIRFERRRKWNRNIKAAPAQSGEHLKPSVTLHSNIISAGAQAHRWMVGIRFYCLEPSIWLSFIFICFISFLPNHIMYFIWQRRLPCVVFFLQMIILLSSHIKKNWLFCVRILPRRSSFFLDVFL